MFDTWAWHEILNGTPTGSKLRRKYLEDEDTRVLTADVSLAELSAKLAEIGKSDAIPAAIDAIIEASNDVVAISRDDAVQAGPLRAELRKTSKNASMVDAVLLSMARNRDATLISCDSAFKGQSDVHCER